MDESVGAAASRLRSLRVLIVEDSWIIAEGLQSLLEGDRHLIDRLHDLGVRLVVVSGFVAFSTPLVKAAVILEQPVEGEAAR